MKVFSAKVRAQDDYWTATKLANVAAELGWRVISILPSNGRGVSIIWVEAPDDADRQEWIRKHNSLGGYQAK